MPTPAASLVSIKEQSLDIALGVDKAWEAKCGEMTDEDDRQTTSAPATRA